MQTALTELIKLSRVGQEADSILRSCVHCGFCLATCPTYRLLGNELDSPRGRIYLIKQALEGNPISAETRTHLDRCLTCLNCETTCPSGVRYGRLLDIGREHVETRVRRGTWDGLMRMGLRTVLPYTHRFSLALKLARASQWLLPKAWTASIPPHQQSDPWPEARHNRRWLVLDGCVQPALAPNINLAAARLLDRLGISLIKTPGARCCGAVSYHLNAQQDGLDFARRCIDEWWPLLEQGMQGIIITASGCGAMVKEYGHLLRDDPAYAARAAKVSAASRDIAEVLAAEKLDTPRFTPGKKGKVAFHTPCTLAHALGVQGTVESILKKAGFELTTVPDSGQCCGSAGTYSILQGELSRKLRTERLSALESGNPQQIASANIGCINHLAAGTATPVRHWVELLEEASRQDADL